LFKYVTDGWNLKYKLSPLCPSVFVSTLSQWKNICLHRVHNMGPRTHLEGRRSSFKRLSNRSFSIIIPQRTVSSELKVFRNFHRLNVFCIGSLPQQLSKTIVPELRTFHNYCTYGTKNGMSHRLNSA